MKSRLHRLGQQAVLVMAIPSFASAAEVFSSGEEMIDTIPITGVENYTYWTAYNVEVPDLSPPDVVQCHAQAEVTTRYPFPIQVVRAIAVVPEEGLHGAAADEVERVTPLFGENITRAIHHDAIVVVATDTGRSGDVQYGLVLQAASTAADPGNALVLEQGYGGLWCTVHRN